jgi:transposase
MAKYKKYSYDQDRLLAIRFDRQILPGTFEYTLSYLIDNEIDLSIFDGRYRNDDTGAPAYDPAILLKVILFAYSRGIVSSRKIAQCCRENIIFMALSADTQPHFTTIADFVSSSEKEIVSLFRNVLLICDELELIGKEMFAIDGCKMPSNASRQWSGTKADFTKKKHKMEKAIRHILKKHRQRDKAEPSSDIIEQDKQYIRTLRRQIKKISAWMDDNDDKPGKTGTPRKSNITDNDSAKMKTSHGVIQGYDAVAAVDDKHQIVVQAEAFGDPQEHDLLEPMIESMRDNFESIGKDKDVFEKAKLTADSGFHTEANMKMLAEERIDGYVADKLFRKRDPRFADADRYKKQHRKERRKREGTLFTVRDFKFDQLLRCCICPAGQRLYRNGGNIKIKGYQAVKFRGPKSACRPCQLRDRCLRHPDRSETRQVAYFAGRSESSADTYTERMKRKIDSEQGRHIYAQRIGAVEPVFAHIRHVLKLDRLTLRGKPKVDAQWKLFCIVHNLIKIHRFGLAPG